jgi:hypothetical protein
MISNERSQNIIVSLVIIAAMVSSVFLVGNAQYYGGSYVLVENVEVSIADTVISNIDPGNESIYPRISFTFNFRTDSPTQGNVRLYSIEASVTLNHDSLSLTVFNRYLTNDPNQYLHPGYDTNFTVARTINSIADRATVLQADNTSTWNWYIALTYSIITFNQRPFQRNLILNWTGSTTVI